MKALKTPFRWYVGDAGIPESEVVKKQLWHRTGNPYALISPTPWLLPFQFFIPGAEALPEDLTISKWELVDVSNPSNRVSLNSYKSAITQFQNGGGLWFTYQYVPINLPIQGKTWYSVIKLLSGRFIVSERFTPFCTENDVQQYTTLEWWNDCDMGGIIYQNGFRNQFITDFIPDELEPVVYEEGTENGIKQFVPTLQIQYDQFRLMGLFPDYVYEALADIRLNKNLTGYWEGNFRKLRAKDVRGDYEGQMAIVTVTLEDWERRVVGGCCENQTQEALFPPEANGDSYTFVHAGNTTYTAPYSVLDNDAGAGLTVTSVTGVTSGFVITMQPGGLFTVTKNTAGNSCSFIYHAQDTFGTVVSANVTVNFSGTVNPGGGVTPGGSTG